jgi:long-chain fatty acid transport protein
VNLHHSHIALVTALIVQVSAREADASGFATARFGSEQGHPTTSNATAIYYNPAGIAGSEGTHLFADALVALRTATYERRVSPSDEPEPADAGGANSGRATLLNVVAAPMLGATSRFGDFAAGLAAYVPFGGNERWDQNSAFDNHPRYPGPVDGVQRWYSIDGEIQSIYFTLALAYALRDLSLGVSGSLIRSSIDTITARTALGTLDVEREGRSQLDAAGWQAGFGLGAIYQALPDKLWLGASYQSRPNVAGGMTLEGTLRNNFTGTVTEAPIDFHQDLPDIYRLGLRYRPRTYLELRLFGDLTRWSALTAHCVSRRGEPCAVNADGSPAPGSGTIQNIRRDWRDAFGVRAGASYFITGVTELFIGAGYDSNAVPDDTLETSFMDFDDISAVVGARFRIAENLHVAGSFLQFYAIPRDTTGKSQHAALRAPSRGPDSGGKYQEWIGAFNANVDVGF